MRYIKELVFDIVRSVQWFWWYRKARKSEHIYMELGDEPIYPASNPLRRSPFGRYFKFEDQKYAIDELLEDWEAKSNA